MGGANPEWPLPTMSDKVRVHEVVKRVVTLQRLIPLVVYACEVPVNGQTCQMNYTFCDN